MLFPCTPTRITARDQTKPAPVRSRSPILIFNPSYNTITATATANRRLAHRAVQPATRSALRAPVDTCEASDEGVDVMSVVSELLVVVTRNESDELAA